MSVHANTPTFLDMIAPTYKMNRNLYERFQKLINMTFCTCIRFFEDQVRSFVTLRIILMMTS
jgi:hypothetical protein